MSAILAYIMFKDVSGAEREAVQKITEFEKVAEADVIFGE